MMDGQLSSVTEMERSMPLADLIASLAARVSASTEPEPDVCPDCDGYGHVIGPHGAGPCHCVKDRLVSDRLDAFSQRVYARYRDAVLAPANLYETDSLQVVREYLASVSVQGQNLRAESGLVICGTTGIGKTTSAIYAASQIIRKDPTARIRLWLNYTDLITDVLFGVEAGNDLRAQRTAIRKQIDQSDAIVIDDIGHSETYQRSDGIGNEVLKRVCDKAMGDFIPTVLICNFSPDDLKRFLTGPVASRLGDKYWQKVLLKGKDLRTK